MTCNEEGEIEVGYASKSRRWEAYGGRLDQCKNNLEKKKGIHPGGGGKRGDTIGKEEDGGQSDMGGITSAARLIGGGRDQMVGAGRGAEGVPPIIDIRG